MVVRNRFEAGGPVRAAQVQLLICFNFDRRELCCAELLRLYEVYNIPLKCKQNRRM